MASPNLDENSPTFQPGGSEEASDVNASPEQGPDVTQPMPAASQADETKGEAPEPMNAPTEQQSMNEQLLEATQPSSLSDEGLNLPPEIPPEPPEAPRGRKRWILWAGLAVLLLALIAAGSAYAGYNSAIDQRTAHEATQVAGDAANQYVLAQQDIALGNYDRARQRLEYIIQIAPNYPGVSEQLANVLTEMRITATPTMAPTPTLTPTPDYRGRDDLFTQAQSSLVGKDWTTTIDTLLLLRKNYPDYMAVKVDDMLYVALRNRGIDKIAEQHDLEGGNYDLTLAERFGPLDAEANNWREWADLYIRGASYWDVDLAQVVSYFAQVADAVPNLSDSSGWTAANRYKDALLGYGDWLAGQGKWCDAQAQYDTYMSLLADPQVEPTAAYASGKCTQSSQVPATAVSETPTPGGETPIPGSETPIPGGETPLPPTETPTPSATPENTTPYP